MSCVFRLNFAGSLSAAPNKPRLQLGFSSNRSRRGPPSLQNLGVVTSSFNLGLLMGTHCIPLYSPYYPRAHTAEPFKEGTTSREHEIQYPQTETSEPGQSANGLGLRALVLGARTRRLSTLNLDNPGEARSPQSTTPSPPNPNPKP